MKVYIDLIIIINFFYDFLIISATSTLLKRNVPILRIIISSILGEISIVTLFISFDKLILILFKILLSILMVYISFGRHKFLESIFYFYVITIILGGSSYLFGGDTYITNVILLMLISPVIITLYIKAIREHKSKLNCLYDVILIEGSESYKFNGYLDTGNKLIDPITKLPVIMINKELNIDAKKKFLVPYKVINNESILECIKVDKVLVDGKCINVLLGLCEKSIFKDNIDVILNDSLREMI
ncbi:MAG: sigma-E processing peptidase SpoIIGA [Bacilli bacterium]|mgnify:CR=1 FL=1|nr:sigma-E processing peptidase SpoIIGA [Bacilli bacterium]